MRKALFVAVCVAFSTPAPALPAGPGGERPTETMVTRPPQPVNGKCPKGWTYEVPPPHRDPHSGLPTGKREHKPVGMCVRSK